MVKEEKEYTDRLAEWGRKIPWIPFEKKTVHFSRPIMEETEENKI